MTSAYEYALNLLSARAYTSRNLRRKLAQREYEPAEIDATIGRLTASGLLDDRKYAAEYARQKLLLAGASARRVEQELERKGIARDVAREAIGAVIEEESIDTEAAVHHAAQKKFAMLGDLEPFVKRRRIFSHLVRRGYDLDEINRAIDRLLSRR